MTKKHVVEILYTERCRHLELALERVREALAVRREGLDVEVRLVLVASFADAMARRFRGSPTVRIDERDVETRPGAAAPVGLLSRGYVVDGRIERAPTVASIAQALDRLATDERMRAGRVRAVAPSYSDASP